MQDRRMYCMVVGRDKPPGLYLALSKLYTYLCKVDQSMALHCFSLFADAAGAHAFFPGRSSLNGGRSVARQPLLLLDN